MLLFDEAPYPGCKSCPDNLLLVTDDQTVQSVLESLLGVRGVAMLAGVGFVLVRRWRRSGPMQRRALAPVAWTGAAVAVVGLTSIDPAADGQRALADVSDTVLIVADHRRAVRVPGRPAALVASRARARSGR